MKKILVVDDEKPISDIVKFNLTKEGYEVFTAYDGEEALEKVKEVEPDLILLDLMLPKLDGLEVAREVRKTYDMPIIMVTAKDSEIDKVLGLELGADDYVTKPFQVDELVARLKVLIRHHSLGTDECIQLGNHIEVNLNAQTVIDKHTKEEIILTGKEHQVLLYLLENGNQILPKEKIFEAVWNESFIHGDKTLIMHIGNLRKKLELNPNKPEIIETFRGIGYRLKR